MENRSPGMVYAGWRPERWQVVRQETTPEGNHPMANHLLTNCLATIFFFLCGNCVGGSSCSE